MRVRSWFAAACLSVLVLTSCSGGDAPPEPTSPPSAQDTASTSTPPAPEASATTATSAPVIAELTPVPCDAPREPTELEAKLLVEPGPYAGDRFDATAAAAAAAAQNPSTDEEWAQAVLSQTQGDYAESVCQMMKFQAGLGEAGATPTAGELPEADVVGQNHFALLLDASGSMAARSGSGTQMDEAKGAIEEFVGNLPESSTVSLRIYGHEGDNTQAGKAESCASSEVVFDGSPDDAAFVDALGGVEPVGYTPLAKAIEDAEGDVPSDATDAVMYVVSDGLETCGGDPVAAARAVAESGVNPIINVIGFHVDNADQQALREIAQAGGGEYTTANSGAELREYWLEEREDLRKAWLAWRDAEIERLRAAYREQVTEITGLADEMRTNLHDDTSSTYAILGELRRTDELDNAGRASVETLLVAHVQEARDYANDFRRNIRDAGENYRVGVRDAYQDANTRWTDFYREDLDD